jgi:tRNA threonylcarbamoyladenosine biosynthesis protein TsaE
VALVGPLGAGKTCFVQGLGRGLGVSSLITSPSFIIIRQHLGPVPLCHADAYRVAGPHELEDAGLLECLETAVVALEWAERAAALWPPELYIVQLSTENEGRRLELSGRGDGPMEVVRELRHAHTGT